MAQSARLVAFPTTPHRAYDLFIPLFFSYPSCHRIPQFFLTCIGILRKGYFSRRPHRNKLIVYPDIYTDRLDFVASKWNTLIFSQYKVSTCYINNVSFDIIDLCIILVFLRTTQRSKTLLLVYVCRVCKTVSLIYKRLV